MWQNLPFFLLWVSGCLQRLCPPWDSRISRGQSQLGAGSDAQVQKRNLSFHSGSLGVKGAQSWPQALPKCSWEMQWGVLELLEAAGRCSACLVPWFTILSFGPCFPLTKGTVTTAPRPQTASNAALIPSGWRIWECLPFIFHPKWISAALGFAFGVQEQRGQPRRVWFGVILNHIFKYSFLFSKTIF